MMSDVGLLGGLFVAVVCGFIGAYLARMRGKDPTVWGILCFLFPVVGLIVLAAFEPVAAKVAGANDHVSAADMKKWKNLVDVDPEIAAAAAKVRAHGERFETILASKYLSLNDKQYLPSLLGKVLEMVQVDQSIPVRGNVGRSTYRKNPDGTYSIVAGVFVGKRFDSHAEMENYCK